MEVSPKPPPSVEVGADGAVRLRMRLPRTMLLPRQTMRIEDRGDPDRVGLNPFEMGRVGSGGETN